VLTEHLVPAHAARRQRGKDYERGDNEQRPLSPPPTFGFFGMGTAAPSEWFVGHGVELGIALEGGKAGAGRPLEVDCGLPIESPHESPQEFSHENRAPFSADAANRPALVCDEED
jgi:hypothetical protein